ncbi:MAG: hypothetical protein RKU31_39965 [Deltaproteobacteria bacterium]
MTLSIAAPPTADVALAKADEFMVFAAMEPALQVILEARASATSREDIARLAYGEGVVRNALGEPIAAFACFVEAETHAPDLEFTRPKSKRSTDRLYRCAEAYVATGGDVFGARAVMARSVDGAEDLDAEVRRRNEETETWSCPVERPKPKLEAVTTPPTPVASSPATAATSPAPSEETSGPAWPWIVGGAVVVVLGAIAIGVAATTERDPFGGTTGAFTMPSRGPEG